MLRKGVLNVQTLFVDIVNAVKPLFNSPFDKGEDKNYYSRPVKGGLGRV